MLMLAVWMTGLFLHSLLLLMVKIGSTMPLRSSTYRENKRGRELSHAPLGSALGLGRMPRDTHFLSPELLKPSSVLV